MATASSKGRFKSGKMGHQIFDFYIDFVLFLFVARIEGVYEVLCCHHVQSRATNQSSQGSVTASVTAELAITSFISNLWQGGVEPSVQTCGTMKYSASQA